MLEFIVALFIITCTALLCRCVYIDITDARNLRRRIRVINRLHSGNSNGCRY